MISACFIATAILIVLCVLNEERKKIVRRRQCLRVITEHQKIYGKYHWCAEERELLKLGGEGY